MVGDTPADTLMGQEVSVYVLSFLMKAMFVEQLLLTLRINAHHHFGPKIFFLTFILIKLQIEREKFKPKGRSVLAIINQIYFQLHQY